MLTVLTPLSFTDWFCITWNILSSSRIVCLKENLGTEQNESQDFSQMKVNYSFTTMAFLLAFNRFVRGNVGLPGTNLKIQVIGFFQSPESGWFISSQVLFGILYT